MRPAARARTRSCGWRSAASRPSTPSRGSRRRSGSPARDIGYAGMKDKPRHDPPVAERARCSTPNARQSHELPGGGVSVLRRRAPPAQAAARPPARQSLRGRADRQRQRRRRRGAARPVRRRRGERRPEPVRRAALRRRTRDNAARGLALLRGERRERDKRKRKLMLSALQSAVFNRALELRATRGPLTPRPARRRAQEDRHGRAVRLDRARGRSAARRRGRGDPDGGPLPGGREIEPPPDTPARALEDEAIAAVGATRDDFARARPRPARARAARFCSGSPTPSSRRRTQRSERARRASPFHAPRGRLRDGGCRSRHEWHRINLC